MVTAMMVTAMMVTAIVSALAARVLPAAATTPAPQHRTVAIAARTAPPSYLDAQVTRFSSLARDSSLPERME